MLVSVVRLGQQSSGEGKAMDRSRWSYNLALGPPDHPVFFRWSAGRRVAFEPFEVAHEPQFRSFSDQGMRRHRRDRTWVLSRPKAMVCSLTMTVPAPFGLRSKPLFLQAPLLASSSTKAHIRSGRPEVASSSSASTGTDPWLGAVFRRQERRRTA